MLHDCRKWSGSCVSVYKFRLNPVVVSHSDLLTTKNPNAGVIHKGRPQKYGKNRPFPLVRFYPHWAIPPPLRADVIWMTPCIIFRLRFTVSWSSANMRSYSLIATMKIMAVTPSKQWIHFLRSDRWPPTSNILTSKNDTRLIRTAHRLLCWCISLKGDGSRFGMGQNYRGSGGRESPAGPGAEPR